VPAQTRKLTKKYRSLTKMGVFSRQSRMQAFCIHSRQELNQCC